MSQKKFDLAKTLALKLENQRKARGAPNRFGQGAAEALDKRERRTRDAAAGLVPFACKLPAELAKQLSERAAAHEGGINAVVAELLNNALASGDATAGEPAAKKAVAKQADAKEAATEAAPAKKAPAKKAAAKKAAS